MGSLLKRAIEQRRKRRDLAGISPADQDEIRREIAHLTEHNRLEVTPELLKAEEGRRGVVFPLVVNLAALLAIAGGVTAFSAVFDPALAATQAAELRALESAEGILLGELREEFESEIAEREAQIAATEERATELEREHEAVIEELAHREQELRDEFENELQAALAAERRRLEGEGIAGTELQGRLEDYETEQRVEFEEELAAEMQALERERERLVQELQTLEQQLQEDQAALAEERERMERELRAAREEADAELEAAFAELSEIEQRARRGEQVDTQVLGAFESLRAAILNGDYQQANAELEELRTVLRDPHVRSLRGESRTEIDLFIAEQLETMIAAQVGAEAPLDLLRSDLLRIVEQGDEALEAGDVELAEQYYREALQAVPELFAGHQVLLERAVDSQRGDWEDEADAERELLQQEVAEARRSMEQLQQASAIQLSLLEQEHEEREAALETELAQARAAAAAARAATLRIEPDEVQADPREIEALRASADRLSRMEERFDGYRDRREAQRRDSASRLLATRELLLEVFRSTEFERSFPGLAEEILRLQQAHFEAGREDALAELVDVLHGVTTLSSNRERKEYLERVLRSGEDDPVLRELLEQLLSLVEDNLVEDNQTALN